ncbi:MAG TPA: hypothetical protein VHA33_29290 [Candidatus Angelobacter sp.]|jgi:hypothetical protein|nr:hypothetical protein [Candidatus Angelobacter sp.]
MRKTQKAPSGAGRRLKVGSPEWNEAVDRLRALPMPPISYMLAKVQGPGLEIFFHAVIKAEGKVVGHVANDINFDNVADLQSSLKRVQDAFGKTSQEITRIVRISARRKGRR